MIRFRTVIPFCWLAAAALAQVPPAPPAAPAPPSPAPIPAPTAKPPVPPKVSGWGGNLDDPFLQDEVRERLLQAQDQISLAQEKAMRLAEERAVDAATLKGRLDLGFGSGLGSGLGLGFAQRIGGPRSAADSLYERGVSALDARRWDQALDAFNEVVARGGSRADGALYWKAYTLNRLGRRDEALAAIAELRKSFASSRWLDDTKALELEVQQAAGQKVSPENQPDDDLKLLALNGLVQTDPDRAFPILENLLKGPQSPQLKRRAMFVLAQNTSPRALQLLEQIARGKSGNPDMQLLAIRFLGETGRQTNRGQLLFDIYNTSSDTAVKRSILSSLEMVRDKDHLLQIARAEKDTDLRLAAIRMLASSASQGEVWQLYQAETAPEVKQQILESISSSGSTDKLIEVARTEKDPKLRRTAIRSLGNVRAANTSEALISIYGSEQDPQVKRTIIDALYSQRNAKALVDLGRKEKDLDARKDIVRRLVEMKSPEANDFLMEILK